MSKSRGRAPIGPQNKVVEAIEKVVDRDGDEREDVEEESTGAKVFREDIEKTFVPEVADVILGKQGDEEEEDIPELKRSEQNRLLRALMHLDCLTQEITSLANEGALVGLFRRTCAEQQIVFNDTSATLWSPLKGVRLVLETLRNRTA